MQRRTNIQVSSLINILSILTILIQFITYHFFESFLLIWGVSCFISFVCCHILLEQTLTYVSCFNYSLMTIFISLVIIILTSFGKVEAFLPYTSIMLGIAFINWFIPMLHCFLRYMFDYGTRIEDFIDFYRNISIEFLLFYFAAIIYGAFVRDAFPWAYPVITASPNFAPFQVIATQIEDYLYDYVSLSEIINYLLSRILAFVPYGFYIALLLRRQTRLPKLFALLLLPFVIETVQYIFLPGSCDIDDLIYAMIGGILGSVLFYLIDLIFHAFSGREFLARENDYRYSGSSLHF